MSKTITIWIDLWTTNSAVVVNHNDKYEVVKNSDHLDYTPSVFGYNKWKNIQVGKKAYEQLFHFADKDSVLNYKAEVKRLMGTNENFSFPRADISLSPEKISGEILKYLKESVLRKYADTDARGVVITVPAYFDTIQKEATKKAGELAWFEHVVLIQEPIAWAIAYGFENKKNENWLVYDLGWGTFDVAIVSSSDWVLTVKWHAWDNYLWWKDIDNLLVDNVIIPAITDKFWISLNRESDKTTYNVLKYIAESAKKELTDGDSVTIIVDNAAIVDASWEQIYFEIPYTRKEFNKLISPLIDKSLELCTKAINDSWLSAADIHKTILIWWPTQIPYVREKLESSLDIQVDTSVDPLTVVAKWASIFGSSQVIPKSTNKDNSTRNKKDTVSLQLNYESMVSDTETMITGIAEGLWDGDYYIQIQSEDGKYSSSKIKLKSGKFFDTLLVQEWKTNIYYIYLSDSSGNILATDPDTFTVTHGLSIAWTPISHSVAIVLNKKDFMWDAAEEYCDAVFEKGSILPLKKTMTYRTTRDLKKGDTENVLPIKIVEWESKKPDRNKQICKVILSGADVPYALPEWTEVNLTLEIDVSWTLSVSAYFPSIDVLKTGKSLRTEGEQDALTSDQLKKDLEEEQKRLEEMSSHLPPEAKEEAQKTITDISKHTDSNDKDTQSRTHSHLRDLKQKLDSYELETESSRIVATFHAEIENFEKIIDEISSDVTNEKEQLEWLKVDWQAAINAKDWEKLDVINTKIVSLKMAIIYNSPEGMKSILGMLYESRSESMDPVKANEIFVRAASAMEANDTHWMRNAINDLYALMPREVQSWLWDISGIGK